MDEDAILNLSPNQRRFQPAKKMPPQKPAEDHHACSTQERSRTFVVRNDRVAGVVEQNFLAIGQVN